MIRMFAHGLIGRFRAGDGLVADATPDLFGAFQRGGETFAGIRTDGSLGRVASDTFDFTVYVGPQFARSAPDVSKAGLFQSWQVYRH